MRRTHFTMNGRIPAAAYYRMSSDKQDRSIDEQREEVRRYAQENGYEIACEYWDEAISGWKAEQRAGFQRLIADAQKGSFQAVLCWDQDRFSRFPVLEANHYWYLLDKAGVHIATVAQGRLDLDDLGGWLKASVTQHGKAEYCRDLSRNTVRGMRERRLKGIWSGRPPYGYRRGEDGKLDLGDPAEVAIVREIFQMRQDGMGFKRIARSSTNARCRRHRSRCGAPRRSNTSCDVIRIAGPCGSASTAQLSTTASRTSRFCSKTRIQRSLTQRCGQRSRR
jgi:site-specific DNA recombinase